MISLNKLSETLSSYCNCEIANESMLICRLAKESDFDFFLLAGDDEFELQAVLRKDPGVKDMWKKIFRKEDYRDELLLEKNLLETLSSVLSNDSVIIIKKGLLFIQFELQIADGGKGRSVHTYGKSRWFCNPPAFSGRTLEYRGIVSALSS